MTTNPSTDSLPTRPSQSQHRVHRRMPINIFTHWADDLLAHLRCLFIFFAGTQTKPPTPGFLPEPALALCLTSFFSKQRSFQQATKIVGPRRLVKGGCPTSSWLCRVRNTHSKKIDPADLFVHLSITHPSIQKLEKQINVLGEPINAPLPNRPSLFLVFSDFRTRQSFWKPRKEPVSG